MSAWLETSLDIGERPVIGQDLRLIQQSLGLDERELGMALGLNTVPLKKLLNEYAEEPIADPSTALLVWMILKYPRYCLLPLFPTPVEVYEVYHKVVAAMPEEEARWLDSRLTFGLLMGRDRSRGYHWFSERTMPKAAYPQTRRLLYAFKAILDARGEAGLRDWRARVELEARHRGSTDIWSSLSWKPSPAPLPVRKRQRRRRKRQPV